MKNSYDITIIGCGHAGIEAAWIASQFNLSVAVITLPGVPLASAPCNPAVGGVGKGQVVREIAALGGLMPSLADMAGIQYRTLNTSRGYAVHSTRVQIDVDAYPMYAEKTINETLNIEVIRERVLGIKKNANSFEVTTEDAKYFSKKIIVTTGTFLNGKMHTGSKITSGGRVDCAASPSLSSLLETVETLPIRFKTGTPPRINIDTIDFSVLIEQKSDCSTWNFSLLDENNKRNLKQVSCYLSETNDNTLKLIRDNKEASPMYNGQIKGVGPRYCPSIEDKAFRYPDRNKHHVFIEPEGLNSKQCYPNGISTSLPKEIQKDFIRTIKGLERAEIETFGYAVEYDVVDTTKLDRCLEYIEVAGLYFAGQVNGTSGYEEAAGQGLIAGINASLAVKGGKKLIINRSDSYIGVLIEDLVSNKRDEPYRLFTARSENRLYIREDNANERMYSYRKSLGLNTAVDKYLEKFHVEHDVLTEFIAKSRYYPNSKTKEEFKELGYGEMKEQSWSIADILKLSHIDPVETLVNELLRLNMVFNPRVVRSVAISAKYADYIKKSDDINTKTARLQNMRLDWSELVKSDNISFECKRRIEEIRPETFGQLKLINGIRPATLTAVAGKLY